MDIYKITTSFSVICWRRRKIQDISGVLPTALVILLLLPGGCAIAPRGYSPPQQEETTIPGNYRPVTGNGSALYLQAEKALESGKYAESEMLLERALRIEPRNPHYWYSMARAKYQQAQYQKTIQFCLKAESLSTRQPEVAELSHVLRRRAQENMK